MPQSQVEIATRCLELDGAEGRLLAEVQVPVGLRFFMGHFSGRPILPGVVQVSEIVLPLIESNWPNLGSLSSIKRLKFKELIVPGDELELSIQLGAERTARFWLKRQGRECSVGTLEFRSHPTVTE